jgi:predicted ATPase
MCSDDGQEETITDIVTLQKDSQRSEHLGLTIREAKQLLNTIQQRLLRHQVDAFDAVEHAWGAFALGAAGKQAEARELLAPICGWFTEGFDTADLQEAKALLEELAGEDRRA